VLALKHHITKTYSIMDLMKGNSLEVSFMLWLLLLPGKELQYTLYESSKSMVPFFVVLLLLNICYSYFSQSTVHTIAIQYLLKSM